MTTTKQNGSERRKLQRWEEKGALTSDGVRALDTLRHRIVIAEKEAADDVGMNAGELRALRLIDEIGDQGVKALGRALGITTTGASGFVNRLVEQKLIERVPTVGQNNIPILAPKLTVEGRKRVKKFLAAYASRLSAITESVDVSSRAALYHAAEVVGGRESVSA